MHNKLEPSLRTTHLPTTPPPSPATLSGLPCRTQCATHHCERVKNRKYENNFPRFIAVPLARCCCCCCSYCCCCCCSCRRCCVKLSVVVAVAATVTSLTRKTIIMIIMLNFGSPHPPTPTQLTQWHRNSGTVPSPPKKKLLQLQVVSLNTHPPPSTYARSLPHALCAPVTAGSLL